MSASILNIDDQVGESITFYPAVRTDFVLIDTVLKGEGREAIYQKITGDEAHPMTVRVGYYPNANSVNISVKMQTYASDGATPPVYTPCTATMAWSMPKIAGGIVATNPFILMAENLFSWLIPVDGGPQHGALDEVKFGVVNALNKAYAA